MQMQQKRLLPEKRVKPKSITRIIIYTVIGVLSSIVIYTLLCIGSFIFLVWFTINGDIKPALKVFTNTTKPIYNVLVETKLKSHITDEYSLNQPLKNESY